VEAFVMGETCVLVGRRTLPEQPRVLLLHPYNVLEGYHYAVPQVALGYLAQALKDAGFTDVHVKDAQLFRWSPDDVLRYVTELRPDVIGLRVWSHQVRVVNEYVERVQAALPNARFIVGGPHITTSPSYITSNPHLDFGIAGEAEEGFPLAVRYLQGVNVELQTIPGLVWRTGESFRVNPVSKREDLDAFGVDWDILNLPAYHAINQRTTAYDHRRSRNGFIFTTRGCPYPCTYCAAGVTNGKRIRAHSAARAMEDIITLYEKYGVRHFNIMDDNFTFYKEHVLEFCDAFLSIRHRLPGVTFHNPNGVRVDRLDDEMLGMMRHCGWKWLHIGIESGSANTLKRMKKRLDLDVCINNIAMIRRHGIKVWGFFILGYKDETREDMEETINFAVKSELNAATFSLFSPIPGTEVYGELLHSGQIAPDYIMSGYMSTKTHVYAAGVTAEDLHKLQRKALIRFYSRPDRAFFLTRDMSLSTIANRVKTIFFPPLVRKVAPELSRTAAN
jgi:anaerobic magnesium-protoporphyrin IX monomethyl ester cyclase